MAVKFSAFQGCFLVIVKYVLAYWISILPVFVSYIVVVSRTCLYNCRMLKTPVQGLSLPPGHVMVNPRWTGTELLRFLKTKLTVLFIESSDCIVDFYPSDQAAVVYLTEGDIISSLNDAKRRIAKLRKMRGVAHRVLYEKTVMTQQYFLELQKMIVVDCRMDIFPVTSPNEAGEYILKMLQQDQTPSKNPFRIKPHNRKPPSDPAILQVVMLFPKIGESRAKLLLDKFKSIRGIMDASVQELSIVIGLAAAKSLKQFLG